MSTVDGPVTRKDLELRLLFSLGTIAVCLTLAIIALAHGGGFAVLVGIVLLLGVVGGLVDIVVAQPRLRRELDELEAARRR